MKKKYRYIYNYKQADFFIKNGLMPCGVGKGKKNDIYILFEDNEEFQKIFNKWCNN